MGLTDAQVYCMTSMIYLFRPPLKPSIGKRRKQSCTPNTYVLICMYVCIYVHMCVVCTHACIIYVMCITCIISIIFNIYVRKKNYTVCNKFVINYFYNYSYNTLSLYIQELCKLSNPIHFT